MLRQEQTIVAISVSKPIQEGLDTNASYVTYLVSCNTRNNSFIVRRRYREFNLLRQLLLAKFIGAYIPPIPSKKIAGNTNDKFVEERKRFLNYFCKKIAERDYLFESEAFKLFLSQKEDFTKNAKIMLGQPTDYIELISLYRTVFPKAQQIGLHAPEIMKKNEMDYVLMKGLERKLEQLRGEFALAAEAKREFVGQFNLCIGTILPNYQKDFLLVHANNDRNCLVVADNQGLQQELKEYLKFNEVNPLEDYIEMISYDLREIRAFIEAIDSRNTTQNLKDRCEESRQSAKVEQEKLSNGQTTLKSLFSRGSKEEQAQKLGKMIEESGQLEKNLSVLIELIDIGICSEIGNYKQRRKVDYVSNLREIAKKSIKALGLYGKLVKLPLQKIKAEH